MEYRKDEKSGEQLSALGFGCMRFPKSRGATDRQETEEMIVKAVEEGINYFDTAYIYVGSEEALGSILKKHNLREKVFITTKLPIVLCKSGADFDKYFYKQLAHLETNYIDYYLIHMLTDVGYWEKLKSWGIEKWIEEKKAKGQIRHIGFSFHGSRDEFLNLLDVYDWELCQIQYNYSDENYQAGVTGLQKAADMGIPVVVMEPLLGGKLATGLPREAVKLFEKADPDITPAAWGLRWLWNQPEVTVVISGMSNISQLNENIQICNSSSVDMFGEPEKEVFRQVIGEFNKSYKVRCTGCNYCMPCPKNVNIPACFAAYNASFAMGYKTGRHQYITSTGSVSTRQSCASICSKCGKCEALCPQNIRIREELEQVKKRMEPLWFRSGLRFVRTILGKNQKTDR